MEMSSCDGVYNYHVMSFSDHKSESQRHGAVTGHIAIRIQMFDLFSKFYKQCSANTFVLQVQGEGEEDLGRLRPRLRSPSSERRLRSGRKFSPFCFVIHV